MEKAIFLKMGRFPILIDLLAWGNVGSEGLDEKHSGLILVAGDIFIH